VRCGLMTDGCTLDMCRVDLVLAVLAGVIWDEAHEDSCTDVQRYHAMPPSDAGLGFRARY